MEKEKNESQKEIKSRNNTIGDKEGTIYNLKRQNQELEKFKFVLDNQIKDLKSQIDPKNDRIQQMKMNIQAMDADLEDYHKKNKQLKINIDQLELKQKSLQQEIVAQRKHIADSQTIIKRFKNDLHESVQFIQEPKQLRESFVALYKKYVPNGIAKQELDPDIQREYTRQRDYLEKSVESLKRKLQKDSEVHRQDNMRILQDNVQLIREIDDLRRDINFLKHERQQQRLNVSSKSRTQKSTQVEIERNKRLIQDVQAQIDVQLKLQETHQRPNENSSKTGLHNETDLIASTSD